MTDSLLSLVVRGTRRIRLFFSAPLATGAFTSLAPYAFANIDGTASPTIDVVAVFGISTDATAVELAIDSDIAEGALYQVTVTAVPMADSSTVTGSLQVRTGSSLAVLPNVEPAQNDSDLLLFFRDIVHDGNDFVEDVNGDLATVTGRDNYQSAIQRRVTSRGLRWDPTYSPDADAYVNAPSILQLPLSGAILAQARLDPRTKTATCTVAPDATDPESFHFALVAQPVDGLQPVQVAIPIN